MRMKNIIIGILCLLSLQLFSAEVERVTVKDVQGNDREYFQFVPESYDGSEPYGLIICLHGFGQSGEDFFTLFGLQNLVNDSKFIIVAPSALPEKDEEVIKQMQTYAPQFPLNAVWGTNMNMKVTVYNVPFGDMIIPQWDVLNVIFNKNVDDSAYINQVLESIKTNYNISSKDVFVFGASMGGYLAYQYALRNSSKLAGIICFNSTMSPTMISRSFGRVNLCDFHSEDDQVIPYTGSYNMVVPYEETTLDATITMGDAKSDVIKMWIGKNRTQPTPEETKYDDVNSTGKSVTKYYYAPGTLGLEVVHYKAKGGLHTDFLLKSNGDCIDYGEEILAFIGRHSTISESTNVNLMEKSAITLSPNPAVDFVTINGTDIRSIKTTIFSLSGQEVYSANNMTNLDISHLNNGIYLVKIVIGENIYTKKLIKR